ncbi:MAG: hypothetical protein IJ478_07910 [Alistipes sp.]|nr:hypothetical protein [Alistipes sp.]
MKRYILFWMATVALVLSSCTKDETGEENPIGGNEINFGMVDTRTIYGTQQDDKSWPVYWSAGDQIKIYCAQTPQGSAVYATDGDGTSPSANISKTDDYPLTWNEQGGVDHTFYAIYPASDKITVDENGIANFPINRNQKATVTTTNGYDGNVTAAADMTNQYMVATTAVNPAELSDGTVWLGFKPIMTTLDVVITAANVTMNTEGSARVTGISIASTISTNSTASKENFYYDIDDGAITSKGATSTDSATEQTEQTFVNLVDAEGKASYVDLAQGHTLTITVFLPPMSKEVAAQLGRKVKVRVHATGNTELVASLKTNDAASDNWTTQLAPGSKSSVKLPAIPTTAQYAGNNWITPLDGDIYVSQMSIPGSHDAATGEEMATIVGDIFASTQEQTLQTQWDLGVRAFDLRPAIYDAIFGSTNELWLYHGMTRVSVSWATAMNTLQANLTKNPGEFAIVLFRHEDEGTLGKNTNSDDFNTYMTNYINANSSWIVDWKPDLTIDECRGKIILISRFSGSWSYGCFTGWSHDAAGATTTLRNANSSKSATMYVQDYYNPSDHDTKWKSIQTYLDISKTFHTDAAKVNHWMINHCSGYVGTSTSSTYRSNAAAQNPKLIEYISSDEWEGSTGIMLFDYSGASLSNGLLTGNVEVYGDVALQAIIDNNYKYRMKRKGE